MSKGSDRTPESFILRDLCRSYGSVRALDGVSLTLRPGEIHVMLGENGAGKSTLVGVLAGMVRLEQGELWREGEEGLRPLVLNNPADARRAGIGVVYQQGSLVPSLSAVENLLLLEGAPLLRQARARQALRGFPELLGGLDPDLPVGDLPMGLRQRLEIALVLWSQAGVLILDEPSALLLPEEARSLETTVQKLATQGATVLWVTHSLEQARRIGDRITVMRAGRVSAAFDRKQLAAAEAVAGEAAAEAEAGHGVLLNAMFGEPAPPDSRGEALNTSARDTSPEPVLALVGVTGPAGDHEIAATNISLTVARGEIVGIAGVAGQGQQSLADAVTGSRNISSGRVILGTQDVTARGIGARRKLGLRSLTDDRIGEGIAGALSIAENITLAEIGRGPSWWHGFLNTRIRSAVAEEAIASFAVRPANPGARAGDLSGGNMQKVLLARELRGAPQLVVCREPSHGLDVRTVELVHDRLQRAAAEGTGILLISSDLDELLALSHRVHVLEGGRLSRGINPREAEARSLVQRAMVRATAEQEHQEREHQEREHQEREHQERENPA